MIRGPQDFRAGRPGQPSASGQLRGCPARKQHLRRESPGRDGSPGVGERPAVRPAASLHPLPGLQAGTGRALRPGGRAGAETATQAAVGESESAPKEREAGRHQCRVTEDRAPPRLAGPRRALRPHARVKPGQQVWGWSRMDLGSPGLPEQTGSCWRGELGCLGPSARLLRKWTSAVS